ncbi:MAG: hypothetical protein IH605_18290 [Burkholderiales bacterium]|nr:hypothetical protein [Burkholderiales bacterium]
MNFKLNLMVAAIAVMGLAACSPDVTPKAPAAAAEAPAPVAAAPAPAAEIAKADQPAAAPVAEMKNEEAAAAPAAEMKKEEGEKKAN